MLNNRDKVSFDEPSHTYKLNKNGKSLISVSQIIKIFTPEFDPDGSILINKAKKEGVTPEELRKKWDQIRDDSCILGKSIHTALENFVNTGKIDKKSEHKEWVKQFSKVKFTGKLQSEVLLFNEEFSLAGTTDLVEWIDDNTYNLADFKSNKTISRYSYNGEKLLEPLDHLYNTSWNKYTLQANLYRFMLEEDGFWWKDYMRLFFFNRKTEKLEIEDFPYMQEEVKEMLKYYKKHGDKLEYRTD